MAGRAAGHPTLGQHPAVIPNPVLQVQLAKMRQPLRSAPDPAAASVNAHGAELPRQRPHADSIKQPGLEIIMNGHSRGFLEYGAEQVGA
ncbi:hypothetical protein D3C71_1866840 [compost metagenome]